MTVPTTAKPTAHAIQDLLTQLQAIHDENRLQRHLGQMEMRTRFEALEQKRAELHTAVTRAQDHAVEALRRSVAELREAFTTFRREAKLEATRAPAGASEPAPEPDHAPPDPEC